MSEERLDLDKIERACRIAEIAKTGIELRAYECRYMLDTIAALRAHIAELEARDADRGKTPQPDRDNEPVAGTA